MLSVLFSQCMSIVDMLDSAVALNVWEGAVQTPARLVSRVPSSSPSPATSLSLPRSTTLTPAKMEDDDELPPMLVNADGTTAEDVALSAELDDVKIAKVPITIITGRYVSHVSFLYYT